MKKLVIEMMENGFSKESTNPFLLPVLLVCNKDGSWWFCVDLRALNALLIPDCFLIPIVNKLINELSGVTTL